MAPRGISMATATRCTSPAAKVVSHAAHSAKAMPSCSTLRSPTRWRSRSRTQTWWSASPNQSPQTIGRGGHDPCAHCLDLYEPILPLLLVLSFSCSPWSVFGPILALARAAQLPTRYAPREPCWGTCPSEALRVQGIDGTPSKVTCYTYCNVTALLLFHGIGHRAAGAAASNAAWGEDRVSACARAAPSAHSAS